MICGIVDLGSNTVRLSIYEYEGNRFKLLINEKSFTGLAGYIDKKGALSDKGIRTACKVINEYKNIAENLHISMFRIFATASLRNIVNTNEVVDKIIERTGLKPDVLTGEEEALLDFQGASSSVDLDNGILIDIGGGSTELVQFENKKPVKYSSIPIGCLNLYSKYVKRILPDKKEYKLINSIVKAELDKIQWIEDEKTSVICGVGGTIRAFKKIHIEMSVNDTSDEINTSYAKKIINTAIKNDDSYELFSKVIPERIHTIIPGMIIFKDIIKRTQAEKIIVSKYGVREGYLLSRIIT
jgi:exopolyphosphatase / guanosine-5'-triphosphate,3'-diphosphate pyrophosphatase